MTDKSRVRGIYKYYGLCLCYERLIDKAGGREILVHTRWGSTMPHKGTYQAFFPTPIGLIVGFSVGLSIKAFDNQTESWTVVVVIYCHLKT